MCFIFRCYRWIINKDNVSNHGFESMHVNNEEKLSLLFDMCVNSQSSMNKDFFIMGNLGEKNILKKNIS